MSLQTNQTPRFQTHQCHSTSYKELFQQACTLTGNEGSRHRECVEKLTNHCASQIHTDNDHTVMANLLQCYAKVKCTDGEDCARKIRECDLYAAQK